MDPRRADARVSRRRVASGLGRGRPPPRRLLGSLRSLVFGEGAGSMSDAESDRTIMRFRLMGGGGDKDEEGDRDEAKNLLEGPAESMVTSSGLKGVAGKV